MPQTICRSPSRNCLVRWCRSSKCKTKRRRWRWRTRRLMAYRAAAVRRDLECGARLARRLQAGMTHVNDSPVNDLPNCPWRREEQQSGAVQTASGRSKNSPQLTGLAYNMNRYLTHCSSEALSRAEGGQLYEPEKKCRAYLGRSHRRDQTRSLLLYRSGAQVPESSRGLFPTSCRVTRRDLASTRVIF